MVRNWVNRAFSVAANAAVPYDANSYYYEIEVLEDPGETRYVPAFHYLLILSAISLHLVKKAAT